MIQDEQAPAAVIPADLRTGQMDGAEPLPAAGFVTKKRTRIRQSVKDTPVFEHADFIRINDNISFLTGIPVEYQKPVVSPVLFDYMNQS